MDHGATGRPLDGLEQGLLGWIGPGGDGERNLEALPTRPVPFALRSISDPKLAHRLRSVTFIGRSGAMLRPCDVLLGSPDVSRVHAHITVRGDELRGWELRVVDEESVSGTDVDGDPVPLGGGGHRLEVGSYLRLGAQELWVIERSSLRARSKRALAAELADEADGGAGAWGAAGTGWREIRVQTKEHHQSIRRCRDWCTLVDVLAEMLHLPEPTVADALALYDDLGGLLSEHRVLTPKEMEDYDVRERCLPDIHVGHIVRLHLTSDPRLLAPQVERMERRRRADEERKSEFLPGG